MARKAFLVELDDSESSECLSDSLSYSETESLAESVGSVESQRKTLSPEADPNSTIVERRKKTKTKSNFMHFTLELHDVPVQATWEFIRDHRMMAALVPGITEHFEYIEGNGDSGSVYVANYSPKVVRPGEPNFVMNKVEVSDDALKMHAWRSVGGKYQVRYDLYMTYIKVMPDEILGDSSSVVVWRFEYELRNPESALPLDTKDAYMTVMNLIKERHKSMNRVERRFWPAEESSQSTESRGVQELLTGAEEQEPEAGAGASRQRGRKARAQRSQSKQSKESDRESRKDLRPWRTASLKFRAGGRGPGFRRRPQFQICEGGDIISTATTSNPSGPLTFIEELLQPHLEQIQPEFRLSR